MGCAGVSGVGGAGLVPRGHLLSPAPRRSAMLPGALSGGLGQGGWTVPSPSSRHIKEQWWSVSGRLLATRDPCLRDPRHQHTPTPGGT